MTHAALHRTTPPVVRRLDSTTIGPTAANLVMEVVRGSDAPVIGVATGSSPSPLYAALSAEKGNFAATRWFALDEYVGLPPNHPQSYVKVLEREIVEPLGLDPSTVHVPNPHVDDLEESAADYERLIAAAGGVDLQVLGIGRNGHLAFNEPGAALDSRTRTERLTEDTRRANERFFDSLAEVPTHCLTQGLGTIREAHALLLIAQGSGKAQALHDALHGPITPRCPASILQLHGNVTVLVDEEAAALLPRDTEGNQTVRN
ncbi:glucosamine-6-phosphate deaminase [Arthrobacter echini]|uniref:Glucosamine-6-phosphate deaminase n=1 Tax=Arthrobacter echini TaxID=1529066 RepID=A0A4V3Z5L8_9MICC|nr:glucosamine-6-phosphate deaminase [Arthrobacter echini]THJ67119.1 glucosamine-6-phosphate deaminase [Arthrobacter echini]